MALPVRLCGTTSRTIAVVRAIITAAPSPCRKRAATSAHRLGARAQLTEATAKMAMPTSNKRVRPNTSLSLPALTISVVSANR
ncbi:hypothetical protein D3C87_2092970 [compost metagenome]